MPPKVHHRSLQALLRRSRNELRCQRRLPQSKWRFSRLLQPHPNNSNPSLLHPSTRDQVYPSKTKHTNTAHMQTQPYSQLQALLSKKQTSKPRHITNTKPKPRTAPHLKRCRIQNPPRIKAPKNSSNKWPAPSHSEHSPASSKTLAVSVQQKLQPQSATSMPTQRHRSQTQRHCSHINPNPKTKHSPSLKIITRSTRTDQSNSKQMQQPHVTRTAPNNSRTKP